MGEDMPLKTRVLLDALASRIADAAERGVEPETVSPAAAP